LHRGWFAPTIKMKNKPIFSVYVGSLSILLNVVPALTGFADKPFASLSLISSTVAWLCYLLSLQVIATDTANKKLLVPLCITLLLTVIYPLADVIYHSRANAIFAATGFLPYVYTLLNYLSRISLLAFALLVLKRKPDVLLIVMTAFCIMVFVSFLCTVYELSITLRKTAMPGLYSMLMRVLDPIAILSIFLLQFHLITQPAKVKKALALPGVLRHIDGN
jgi:hypothetical protein